VLAFDFGLRRIGLASGDTLTGTAKVRPAVRVNPSGPDWEAIGRAVRSLEPHLLVVGLPCQADGSPGTLAPAARRFAAELTQRFGLPVSHVDEHGSSLEASRLLAEQREGGQRRRRVRAEDVDSRAAAIILERWLAGERR
jgi:putative Holliday junction resolvase